MMIWLDDKIMLKRVGLGSRCSVDRLLVFQSGVDIVGFAIVVA